MEEKKLLHVLRFILLLFISSNTFATTKLYVFVSSSMGKELLKSYVIEAANHEATLVFIGLVDSSFVATANLVSEILGGNEISIIIHDDLFTKYNISRVPSFILLDESSEKYDKILGNIGIGNAISIFKEKGEILR